MFRTSNVRGQRRYDQLHLLKQATQGQVQLLPQQVKSIEETDYLTLGEKIELLLVALGNKLTTELYLTIQYELNKTTDQYEARPQDLKNIQELLSQLPFIYFQDSLAKKNRHAGKPEKFTWFQVSVNEAVNTFMRDFPDDLTEYEEGVLYGFPLSAIRAYSGLITPSYDKPTAASYFLGGVGSQDFQADELAYYDLWWNRLRRLSPRIIQEAEKKFRAESKKAWNP